jgi:LPPG:FO 2-phospho-L-lactate transferase
VIVIAPSNPLVSVEPILAVRGVREVLRRRRQRVVAVTPLVAGRPLKGPLHRMLRGLGLEVSPRGVARRYLASRDVRARRARSRRGGRRSKRSGSGSS